MEIAVGLELAAHAIDLPAFDLGLEIPREHLQPADELVADIDIGDLERALAQGDARDILFRGVGADIGGPLFREVPQRFRVLEADALDQFADRKAKTRHDGAELVTGSVPADMPAFEHGDAGAHPRRFQRHRQSGKAGADDADIDVEVEGKPRALTQGCGVGPLGRACESLDHAVFLRPLFLTKPWRACHLVLRLGL